MRLVIACAALSAALRDEVGRLELEAGDEKLSQKEATNGWPQMELMSREPSTVAHNTQAGAFLEEYGEVITTANCIDGTLHLQGVNVVNSVLVFSKECAVLRGEPGSQVILEQPIIFEGDLQMEGELEITAVSAFRGACVEVRGNAVTVGKILFQNCHNEDTTNKDAGGGLRVQQNLTQDAGALRFHNCSAGLGGGLASWSLTQNDGSLEFQNCRCSHVGGGLYVDVMTQNKGSLEFRNCSSQKQGGGLYSVGLTQNNGRMEFSNCSNGKWSGGGLYIFKYITQNNGTMDFQNCRSGTGGGLATSRNVKEMVQNNGTITFQNCSSIRDGGGLYVYQNLTQNDGRIEFQNCYSQKSGGGLHLSNFMTQNNGNIEFHNCSSRQDGGGFSSFFMTQNSGSMMFHSCYAQHGGGLFTGGIRQNSGSIEFRNCGSNGYGGGLRSRKVEQNNGMIQFRNCSSTRDGGGLYIYTDVQQNNGTMEFHSCSSQQNGGGMYVPRDYNFRHGAASFHHCTAKGDGGGLWVHRFQQEASLAFYNCRAALGGGINAHFLNGTSPIVFHQCQATEAGGGLRIDGLEGSALDQIQAEECSAAKAAAIQARNLTIKSLVLVDTFNQTIDAVGLNVSKLSFRVSEGTKPDLSIEAVNLQIDSDVDCSKLRECRFITSSAPKIGSFQCSLGAGVSQHPAFGCLACPEGYTQIEHITNGPCRVCPKGASLCHAAKIQMMHGLMLHEGNVGRPLHCPTKAACQGGELPTNESRPMCQKGYGGEGCASCIRDNGTLYLMPDSSVLACTACALDGWSQILQWCSYLSQKAVLFAVSAASIFAAGNADRVKNSGVYLNQLMAFAAVSGSVVTAVMQTETAQSMKSAAVEFLYGTALFLSEAGSGQGSKSSHCLLSYLGLESSGVFGVHLLDVVVAMLLVLLLSLKDFRVALVAGLNCFLPSILEDFAKYGVCYSLEEEEDRKGGMDTLICKYLPFQNVLGFAVVGAGFVTILAVSLFTWIRLSTSEATEDELPSHVAFLTNKYGKGRRYFEAERLVRKVFLATVAAFFPSTTFPSEQMTGLTIITCASVFLYGVFQPYHQQVWNWSELGLLVTALILISVACAVIANEEQWNKTEIGQISMIVTLGAIVTTVCSAFMIKIALEVWHERQPRLSHSE